MDNKPHVSHKERKMKEAQNKKSNPRLQRNPQPAPTHNQDSPLAHDHVRREQAKKEAEKDAK